MLRQKLLPAILVVLPATAALTAQTTMVEATADECRTRPGSVAPSGSHWYYRINHRRCWFLSSQRMGVRSRTSQGASFGRRHVVGRSLSAVQKRLAQHDRQLDARIASAQTESAEAVLAVTRATAANFSTRWLDLPNSEALEVRKIATTSYTDASLAKDAEQHTPSVPVGDAKRSRQQQAAAAGEAALEIVFLGGALLTGLLVAGGVFHLARRPRRTHSSDQWCATADQRASATMSSQAPLIRPGNRLAAGTRRNSFFGSALTPTNPAEDLETSLRVLTRDLRRVAAATVSPRSFSPRTRTGAPGQRVRA